MTEVFVIFCALFGVFAFVMLFGAPYLPTLKPQINEALDLLDLKPGQTLLELGSGDGRVMLAAAKRGLNVVGFELNPLLVIFSWLLTLRYRRQVKIYWGNYWKKTWPPADGIFVFLLDKYMKKLDGEIEIYRHNRAIKLVSFAFQIPQKQASKERSGIFLYEYS